MSAVLGTARPHAGTDLYSPERPAAVHRAGQAHPASAPDAAHQAIAAATRVFPAQPLQVAQVRRFVAGVLSGFAAADDVVLCVSELASNAVLHSSSRRPGGQFTVRAGISPAGRIRAEVEDCGGPWAPGPGQDEERGRGLLIVGGLATRWGISGGDAGRMAWLEIDSAAPG
jgi:serine/threonine-protein kinase RsbW